jgi:hypothetical protein
MRFDRSPGVRSFVAAAVLVLVAGCAPAPSSTASTGPEASPARAQATADVANAATRTPSRAPVVVATPSPTPSSPIPSSPAAAKPPKATALEVQLAHEGAVSRIPGSVADRAWEPVVATHPTDPNRIAVVYEHRGPGAPCSVNPTIRITHDGGRTWRSAKRSPAAGSGRGIGLHAAIAWGPGPKGRSRLYWADMTSPGCSGSNFSMSTAYSDDEGASWSKLHVERSTRPWVGGFPEIAVDRDPNSPNYGVVYAGYNWLPAGARGPGFRMLASADFGKSWNAANVAPAPSPGAYRDFWRIAYRLRPAPDGSVYASWYQVDMRHWDRTNIFAKGGSGNVGRLGVAIANVTFDRSRKALHVGPSRIAATVKETVFTTSGGSAPGTGAEIRPDPMWQYGFDVDPASGRIYVAVGGFGSSTKRSPRGTIRVGHSDDGGSTWSFKRLPTAPDVKGKRQSSFKPNLVAGPGYVLVTFHTLDDVASAATVGGAYTVSSDGGSSWRTPTTAASKRWRASTLGGATNGIGLRERAERLADGGVFWAYGDGRHARGSAAGRTAIYGARIAVRSGT